MFGKRMHPDDPANFRSSRRVSARGLSALIDAVPAELLDYSEGGIRAQVSSPPKRTVLIEIYRGRELFRKCAAVIAWERGQEVGFAFRPNQRIYEVSEPLARPERQPAEEDEDDARNATGGVAGSALRRRLNL